MKYFVGIDVSKAKLDFAIDNSKLFKGFENNEEGIREAIQWLRSNVNGHVKIIVESTSWYHWLVCLFLSEEGYDIRLINPIITRKYQKSSIRDSKNDKIDAFRLAEIAKLESKLPKFFDSRESLKNKRIHTLLSTLENVKQQFKRSLNDAIEAFANIGVTIDTKELEEALSSIEIAISTCKKMIEDNSDKLAKRIAELRGISTFQASVLSTAVSGRKFKKRGNPYYRKILFHIGWGLKQNNDIFKKYYDKLRAEGKHYYTAIIATARKFLYYFFKIYKECV